MSGIKRLSNSLSTALITPHVHDDACVPSANLGENVPACVVYYGCAYRSGFMIVFSWVGIQLLALEFSYSPGLWKFTSPLKFKRVEKGET